MKTIRTTLIVAAFVVGIGGAFAAKSDVKLSKKLLDDSYVDENCQPVTCGDYQTMACSSLILYLPDDCQGEQILDASGNVRPF